MFYGEYIHTLDRKHRVIIPARLREAVDAEMDGKGFFLTLGLDTCLLMFTPRQWRILEHNISRIPIGKAAGRMFKRTFFGSAVREEYDKQGRILIPERLLRKVRITTEVQFVGVSDYIELWDPAIHEKNLVQSESQYGQLAEELIDSSFIERGES